METTVRNVITFSVALSCPYEKAFHYLSTPINHKEWAIHFFQDIELINGQAIATLPFGKLPMEIGANLNTGILDIYLGDNRPTRTRLIEIEEGICMYNFTLAQPAGMPNEVWENEASPNMQDELNTLKSILETAVL